MTNAMGMMDPQMLRDMMGGGMVMFQSIMLARLLAPIMLIAGLGVLFNGASMKEMMDEMAKGKQQLLLFVSGFFTLVCGMLMVMSHNIWTLNWSLIITIVSWLLVVKGASLVLFPRLSIMVASASKKMGWMVPVAGTLILILGLVLAYFGYFTGSRPFMM